MKASKLSIRLLWYITPLVILPLLFLGGFTLSNVTSSTQKQAEFIVSRFIEQQQQEIFNYIDSFHSTNKLLSTSPVLNDFLTQAQRDNTSRARHLDALKDVFASYSDAYPDIISINLLSPLGKSNAFYSKNVKEAPENYSFFPQVLHNNLRHQEFIHQQNDGSTSLYFIQRIYNTHQNPTQSKQIGFIILHIEPSILNSSILEAPYNNALNMILTNKGKILFSSDHSKRGQYVSEYELKKIDMAAGSKKLSAIKLSSIDRIERMIYAVKMANGYYYASAIPKNLLYQSGKAISLITTIVIFISVILLPILIYIVVRNLLLKPIELLGTASHHVGDGDLSVYLPAHKKDEIGVLFNDFNHMVNQIRHYQTELEEYKVHLEDKVENRTKALEIMNTQLENAKCQAEQANQLKSRFLANMSHEIRTPLTAIMGFTEQILQSNKPSDSSLYLTTILRNSKYLLELINNILDLSKIEAEKLIVEKMPLNIVQLIQDIEAIIRPLSQEKKLQFTINFHFPLPQTIYSDMTRLKQILLNIASNAVKFTKYGEITLDITFDAKTQLINFAIKDSGIGMTKQQIERIFKPFEQADATTTRQFGGTGLGLCISKNLAQQLGGDIFVQSSPAKGSCFNVNIASNLTQLSDAVMLTDSSQLKPEKAVDLSFAENHFDANILVAEDNPDNQMLISLLLKTWGLEPDIANNGEEAIEMALVNDYQMVIMDMQMPVMGGEQATKLLRSAAYDVPIIALTANVMNHDIDSYLAAGCNETLAKPIIKHELENVLAKYLQIDKENGKSWDTLFNSDKFKQLNNDYLAKLPDHLAQINNLYQQKEWHALKMLAHNLKGSAGCFGYEDIHQAAAALEACLRYNKNNRDNVVLDLIKTIKETHSEVLTK